MWFAVVHFIPTHITSTPTYQDSGWVFWATCVAIAIMFIWGKLAAYFNGQTGTIASLPEFKNCRPEPISIPVDLWSGRRVTASVEGCTVCSQGLTAGDKVWVTEAANGYVVIRAKSQSLKRLWREVAVESSRECLLKPRASQDR